MPCLGAFEAALGGDDIGWDAMSFGTSKQIIDRVRELQSVAIILEKFA